MPSLAGREATKPPWLWTFCLMGSRALLGQAILPAKAGCSMERSLKLSPAAKTCSARRFRRRQSSPRAVPLL